MAKTESAQDKAKRERADRYQYWADEIENAQKAFDDYQKRCKDIVKRYRGPKRGGSEGEEGGPNGDRLNIFWSNVETLKPAMYSRTPQPNVARRFLDRDPVSRTAALIAERNLITAVELCDFDYPMKRSRDDYLITARGVVWVRYDPEFGTKKVRNPVTRVDLKGTGRSVYRPAAGGEEIDAKDVKQDEDDDSYYVESDEETVLTHGLAVDSIVSWKDYLHEPVNDWKKVGWQAKRVQMKRPALIKHFGEDVGRAVELNKTTRYDGLEDDDRSKGNFGASRAKAKCADVWEIVSRDERKVIWWSDGFKQGTLKEIDDPLNLSSFWPTPRPLFGTTTTDNLEPVPDFIYYKDQADQLDELTNRINTLVKALRVVGFYNKEMVELQDLLSEASENQMIAIENWVVFVQQGGFKGSVDWLPIDQIAAVLEGLVKLRAQIKADSYEINGISDIVRGMGDPNATATQEQIKSNFANLRLTDRQAEMARFARDTLRIMAEIQCEHYPAEVLIEMSGVREMDEFRIPEMPQPPAPLNPADPNDQQRFQAETQKFQQAQQAVEAKQQEVEQRLMAAVELLKSDRLRSFRIDIETDATVAPDQQKEKETRVEFLQAVAPFLEKAAQVGQQAPQMVPLLMKMLEFGVRGFRAGRTLEAAIEETISIAEQMQQQAQQNPQEQTDPEAEAAAAKLKAETEKVQQELQKLQAEIAAQQAENERKRLADEERRNQAREQFQKAMLKLTEEIQFRREENALKKTELEASIRKLELEIERITGEKAVADIQGMMTPAQPEVPPDEQEAVAAERKSRLATAQTALVKAQTDYMKLKREATGLDAIEDATGEMPEADPSKIGTPLFGKKKGPMKKMIGFIRDPETREISGATVDEIELPAEEEDAA